MARILLITLLFVMALAPARAADAFLSVIEDIPLMSGLAEEADAAVSFETADGRIAETSARGPVAVTEARQFYRTVLPQIGWQPSADGLYRRDREKLRLVFEDDGKGGVSIGFMVSPGTP